MSGRMDYGNVKSHITYATVSRSSSIMTSFDMCFLVIGFVWIMKLQLC